MGYLNWLWPAYVISTIFAFGFFALFFRRHRLALLYFGVVSITSFTFQSVWQTYKPALNDLIQVSSLIAVTLVLIEPLFIVGYTLRTPHNANDLNANQDPRTAWFNVHNIDKGALTWIAVMLTIAIFCFLAVTGIRWISLPFLNNSILATMAPNLVLTPLSAALGGAIVSATIYTLHNEPSFPVGPRWSYSDSFHPITIRRIARDGNGAGSSHSQWYARLRNTLDRLAVTSSNVVIEAIENTSVFVVRLVNQLTRNIVELANTFRRVILKTLHHLEVSGRRFGHLLAWSMIWSWETFKRYAEVFVLPPMLAWFSAITLYGLSDSLFQYIHGGLVILVLAMLSQSLLLLVLLTCACGLLFHVSFLTIVNKVLSALAVFGTTAYLNLLGIAWLLGILGLLTNGPYRIGWVTVISTVPLVYVFLRTFWRPSVKT